MLFQLLHDDFNRLLKLSVMTSSPCGRFEIDFDIWRDAVIFDLPIAVQSVDGCTRRGDTATVNEFRIAADPHESAPWFFSNQLTDPALRKSPRQSIAAGTGHHINHHHHRSVYGLRRARPVVAFPRHYFA